MANRVTTSMVYGSLMGSLQNNLQNLLTLERQLSTQNKYLKLSDNPAAISRSLSLQSSITSNTRYIQNQEDAIAVLKYSETAMDTVLDILQTIRTKVIYAGDGALGPTEVDAIANEIDALKDQLMDTLNTKVAGKYIFGGTDTTTKPFVMDASGQIRYVGSDERIRYQIEEGLLSDVSFTGKDIMDNAYKSYFVCSHYVPTDWQWTGREEKVQITVGNRTLSVFIPEEWIDEVATGSTKPTDYNEFRDPEEVTGISLDDLAMLVNRALKEQGADMLVTATVEKNYDAGQQRLVFKSNTGEPISVTDWPDTDYLPMPQSIAGLEMKTVPDWNHTMLAGSASVDFSGLSAKSLQVYVGGTSVSVDLTSVMDMTDLLSELNTKLAPHSVTAVEQNGKVALISSNGDPLQVDGTAVEAIFGAVSVSKVPEYKGLMGSVNTLGWKGDGLGKEISITAGGVMETFKLDDYKNITELVQAINAKIPKGAGDADFASIVSGRLVLQSTQGDIAVQDTGGTTGGTAQLFGQGYVGGIESSSSSLTIQLGDAQAIKIYINKGDSLAVIADRLNAIEGVYARTSADGDQIVVVAERTGDAPADPLAVDSATEKLHYPSFNLQAGGMAMSLFDFSYTVDSATGVETGIAASKEKTRPVDHSHMDVFDYLGMETTLKSREYKTGEVLKVGTYDPVAGTYGGEPLHWRVISGSHVTDIKLNPGEYTMEQLAERLKNAGAGWLEVTVDVFRGENTPSTDDTETGLGTSANKEDATSRLVIRATDGSSVAIMDMNGERYAEEIGLSTALRSDENMGMDEIVLPTAPCVDPNLAAMVRVQKTCGMTLDIRLARKDIMNSDGAVDRVKVMEQIAKQANAQAGYEFLRVVIPVDANGQKLTASASLVSVTGEPFEVVDLPFLDPSWSDSYTPGIAAQMGIHGGVTSNLKLTDGTENIKDDTKMGMSGTIRFESLGHSVEIDVTANDTVKTIMDRLRSQAGDWLYVNYFDAAMGNSAGQEGNYPIISIAAKDGSAVNVIDVAGTVAKDKLLLNTSIQGEVKLVNPDGTIPGTAWTAMPGSTPPQTFSITVGGYTHTIDLTAMRDINGNGVMDAVDLAATINARMQDYDVQAELNKDGFLVLWSPRGYMIEVEALELTTPVPNNITGQFLGAGSPSTAYRGGYDLENPSRTAPGIYTQNVTTRGGANQTRQSFFGVLDDISAAVRAENRDGLSD
ncbi:MAG: flagellar hook-associated protein FlgL, partial [Synergistaceae bacterium]|nr:flagellar hook-associated protein FlgL [Synergistaceae bacterium]